MANTKIQSEQIEDDIALGGNPTTTTQSAGNNTTRVATTAFVTTAVANLVDSAPSALDTLNELAAALGDDANFATTVTNSIATKLPLAGGTLTGALSVNSGTTNTTATFTSSDAGAGINLTDNSGTSTLQTNGANLRIGVDEAGAVSSSAIQFRVDGSTKATLDSNGNLGIGVTPSASHFTTLEIGTVGSGITGRGAADTHILSGLYWDGASTRKYAVSGVAVGTYQITNGIHYWSSPASGTAGNTATVSANMTLDASGNLGIGTTSPSFTAVSGSTSQKGLHIQNSGNDTSAHLKLTGHNNTGTPGQATDFEIIHRGDALQTIFRHGGADALTLDSSSNLLIGTTVLTDISSSGTGNEGSFIKADGSSGFATSNQTLMTLNRKTSNGDVFEFRKDGTLIGSIGIEGGDSLYIQSDGASGGGLRFHNNGGIAPMRNGSLIDNVVDLGTSTKRFRDLYLSGGLFIGGTGSANELDDYEEGTWTPTFTGGSSNPTVSYSAQSGSYTKVGRIVTVQVYVQSSAFSGGSGDLKISGLPFLSITPHCSVQSEYIGITMPSNANNVITRLNPSSQAFTLEFLDTREGNTITNRGSVSVSSASSPVRLIATFTYMTS